MDITKNTTDDVQELLVTGRIDGAGANQLEVEILAATRTSAKSIFVNLSQTTFLCSAGLRVLLQYWRQMKNAGRSLQVANPSAEVDAVLTMTGFRDQIVEGARGPTS